MFIKDDKTAFLFSEPEDKPPIKVVFPDVNSCPIAPYTVCKYSKLKWDDMTLCLYCELKERDETNCRVLAKNKDLKY